MKVLVPFTLLLAGAGLMQAAIIQTISLNLSPLHMGSILSGTFTLSNSPKVGDTAPVQLSFNDPSDYLPTSLLSTITVSSGISGGYMVYFSPLTFTNLRGAVTPINTRDLSLMPFGFAVCASFPCTATGGFQDRSPAVFSSTYTITPASIPEPGYALLLPTLLTAIVFGRRLVRPMRTPSL